MTDREVAYSFAGCVLSGSHSKRKAGGAEKNDCFNVHHLEVPVENMATLAGPEAQHKSTLISLLEFNSP